MKNKNSVLEEIKNYEQKFPGESETIKDFVAFVKETEGSQLFSRKNFMGHITASAFVVNEKWDSVLMIKHKFLNRWLQPGGHVDEQDESVLSAAEREVFEETGISAASLQPVFDYIFDIDSHSIPQNIKKNEPAHIHHDARYLFTCNENNILTLDTSEVSAFEWITFDQLSELSGFKPVAEKLLKTKMSLSK